MDVPAPTPRCAAANHELIFCVSTVRPRCTAANGETIFCVSTRSSSGGVGGVPPWGAAADHEFLILEGSKITPETTLETPIKARGRDLGVHFRSREIPTWGPRATKRHFGKLCSVTGSECPWDAFGGGRPPQRGSKPQRGCQRTKAEFCARH